jgi:hypothetical protein
MHERDPERSIIDHANGFTVVNTRAFKPATKHDVLPSQCEQVFYSEVPSKAGWSYVIRYDLRGRPIKYTHVEEEDNIEEEDDDADQEQVVVDVSDEEAEEVDHPNVGDNVLIDNINDDSENDIDNDVDMNDPFNIINFELYHDTYVDLYEEEDE